VSFIPEGSDTEPGLTRYWKNTHAEPHCAGTHQEY